MWASDPAISNLCQPISAKFPQTCATQTKQENRIMSHDHVEMRLRSLVFIAFQGCPVWFRVDLIKCTHVSFNSKTHFLLSKLRSSIVKIGPLKKRNLIPWLEFVTKLPKINTSSHLGWNSNHVIISCPISRLPSSSVVTAHLGSSLLIPSHLLLVSTHMLSILKYKRRIIWNWRGG